MSTIVVHIIEKRSDNINTNIGVVPLEDLEKSLSQYVKHVSDCDDYNTYNPEEYMSSDHQTVDFNVITRTYPGTPKYTEQPVNEQLTIELTYYPLGVINFIC